MPLISLRAHAKVNLGLIIKGKRPDGYHLLETVFLPVPLADEMQFETMEGDRCEIEMTGFTEQLNPENNLIWKAWSLMREKYPDQVKGLRVQVTKHIPPGAGLGGGSSNAGYTLRAINHLYQLHAGNRALAALGEKLGADVPFFIYGIPLFASGIGTAFEEILLPKNFTVQIVTPPVHSSTPEAYRDLDWSRLDTTTDLKSILRMPVHEWRFYLRNDLEGPVFAKYPELAKIKQDLYNAGAFYASMSGSGSAVYGLFPKR